MLDLTGQIAIGTLLFTLDRLRDPPLDFTRPAPIRTISPAQTKREEVRARLGK
jgi:hypothetical protein